MQGKLSKKYRIFTGFIGLFVLASPPATAAYPAGGGQTIQYQAQVQYQGPVQYQQASQYPQQYAVPQQGYIPANQIARYPSATMPNRITGSLPKVGNAYVNAGRKYYQPEGFDRLSDSGLYVGVSLGYTYSVGGGMIAEYADQPDAWYVPGAFQTAKFAYGTVLPIQISVGAAINNDVRVDFSYLRYSGISYPGTVQTSDGADGFFDVQATDGRVSTTATMLNLYYNLDSYTGVLASGSLRPYIGIGLGISTNTISDYLVYDASFYPEPDIYDGDVPVPGTLTAISDVYAYHSGGTTEQLSYALEGGVTTELDGGLKIDFFMRWANLGRVESSGSVVVSQTEWLATGAAPIGVNGSEQPADYDSVFHYTNWKEGGSMTSIDLGVRLRIQF
jgi:hypothetical protein